MSSLNFSSGDKVAQAIDKRIIAIAKQVANKSSVNRTVFGRVTAKNNGLFSLRINNTIYTNVIALKNSNYINVGDKVVCLVPNNQFNDLLILGVADGSLLATSGYTLNQASSTELGGIKANNRTVEDQEVRIDPNTGFLYYSQGKSIESIQKTSTSGLVDTYTITYTDGTYTTFTVTNADQIDIQYINGQLQWKYASETTWTTLFTVDSDLSTTSTNPIQNQVVTNAINNKIDINQGVSNVGKVLTVGSDGNVFPQDIPSGSGTIVNVNNVPQATINFTSDPQTQINNIWETIYPIDSIYISVSNTSPASLFGGQWEALSEGYTLWTTTTSGQGGQTIEAGLPNIEGGIGNVYNASGASGVSGSIIQKSNTTSGLSPADAAIGTYRDYLDASAGNSIYGNSDTVQPPAIKVYMWKRVS